MVLVVALELEPALVDQVVIEDSCIRELNGVVRVGLVGGTGSESARARVEISLFVLVPEAVAHRHGVPLTHLPVEPDGCVVANVGTEKIDAVIEVVRKYAGTVGENGVGDEPGAHALLVAAVYTEKKRR